MTVLHIGNKNYSSWSLRPWVLMQELGIPFEERLHRFGIDDFGFSPSRCVPLLQEGDATVWDSLAIAEYLAETHPTVWPENRVARAWARSATAEMHSGFSALRGTCSMSCGHRITLRAVKPELQADLARLQSLWNDGLSRFGGPFLAGNRFTAVDAFYAPVAFRIQTYGLQLDQACLDYAARLRALPSMQAWYTEGLAETFRDPPHDAWVTASGDVTADLRAPATA